MYLRWAIVFLISLALAGCAFVDGLHNQQEQAPAESNGEAVSTKSPGTAVPSSGTKENQADTNAAKAMAPLTH